MLALDGPVPAGQWRPQLVAGSNPRVHGDLVGAVVHDPVLGGLLRCGKGGDVAPVSEAPYCLIVAHLLHPTSLGFGPEELRNLPDMTLDQAVVPRLVATPLLDRAQVLTRLLPKTAGVRNISSSTPADKTREDPIGVANGPRELNNHGPPERRALIHAALLRARLELRCNNATNLLHRTLRRESTCNVQLQT